MIQHLFTSYGEIDRIDLEENAVKTMGPYEPAVPLSHVIEELEKGRDFSHAGGKTVSNVVIVFNRIPLLAQTATFNKDI